MENDYNDIIMIGIYKITFPNGVYYFGQGIDLRRRELQHIRESKKGKHTNPRFQYCWNKYGEFKFEILEECDRNDLDRIESDYIIKHIDNELCCNMCRIGRSRKGVKATNETKEKISQYQYLVGKTKEVYMFSQHFDLLAKFDSVVKAQEAINAGAKTVSLSCRSRGKYNVKGYKFLFAAEVDIFLNYAKEMVKL
jgi:hypothetical protein